VLGDAQWVPSCARRSHRDQQAIRFGDAGGVGGDNYSRRLPRTRRAHSLGKRDAEIKDDCDSMCVRDLLDDEQTLPRPIDTDAPFSPSASPGEFNHLAGSPVVCPLGLTWQALF